MEENLHANTSSSGGAEPPSLGSFLPKQGKYLAGVKLRGLRDLLVMVFADSPSAIISLEEGEEILGRAWRDIGLSGPPGRSHTYRHLLTLRLLGLTRPAPPSGYGLTALGAGFLQIAHPGVPLSPGETDLLGESFLHPPPDLSSPLLELADLIAPGQRSRSGFVEEGQPIRVRRYSLKHLELATPRETRTVEDDDEIDHLLHGIEPLFREAELLTDLPGDSTVSYDERIVFPVRRVTPKSEGEVLDAVVSYLRTKFSRRPRIYLATVSTDLRPAMKLSQPDFEYILTRISDEYAGEFYFDRLSSSMIAGRENAYAFIKGFWRASIVRA